MLTASRSVNKAKNTGIALPQIPELADLYTLEGHGPDLYKGQVMMIAGQPGSQKSGFALWLVTKLGLPTLYFAMDSDAATMASRTAATYTGVDSRQIRKDFKDDNKRAYYEDALDECKIVFNFDSSPGLSEMRQSIDAWVEMFDTWPDIIVIDNLIDCWDEGGDNEFSAQKNLLKEFKGLARATDALVIVLHHVSEAGSDPDKPGPRKAIQGKPGQTPALIFSIALDGDQFMIAPVKSRHSKQWPNGKVYATLVADPARNQFRRQTPLNQQVEYAMQWERENGLEDG